MRRLITVLIVLVLLAVVVDRAAWWFAQRAIAGQVQETADLDERPNVSVHGFPFLTQALRGRYKQIDADLRNPAVEGGLKIDELDIKFRGVRVSTGDLLNRRVDAVPVDSANAVATVSFATMNAAAKENLASARGSTVKFGPGGGGNVLAVSGAYRSSGVKVALNAKAKLVAEDGDLVVKVAPGALDGIPRQARGQVTQLLKKASRLPDLPFGFQAKSVTVNGSGLTVQATSRTLDLHTDLP
jgi:DUF2993 family protein